MAHSVSATKRARQNERRRLYNKSIKSGVRTAMKKFHALVEEGKLDEAKTSYGKAARKLDQAAAKGILHKNTTSRYKSRLALLLNRASAK